jgi:phosphate transport system substrate-binding protein
MRARRAATLAAMPKSERRPVLVRPASRTILLALLAVLVLVAAACGRESESSSDGGSANAANNESEEQLSGSIEADGSSTVGPFTTYAAELFQQEHPGVRVTVGISGTGGGFERFCVGETDISNASRPIDEEEVAVCEENGIDYVELHAVNDGLAVVVNPENDWADCLTVEELNTIWRPEAEGEITNWNQVRPDFPDVPLTLAGAGTDSGTFDYFTEAINGESGATRTDYTASEDDNVTVQAVEGDTGGMGYFGLSYVEENEGRVKAVAVENEDGECVPPSTETVQDGSYNPLGRPLFLYAKQESFSRPEIQAFMQFALDRNAEIAEGALFVPLTDEQLQTAQGGLDSAIAAAGS